MSHTLYPLRKQRLQRSELAVPASNPSMIDKAAAGPADFVFLDLEDAVVTPVAHWLGVAPGVAHLHVVFAAFAHGAENGVGVVGEDVSALVLVGRGLAVGRSGDRLLRFHRRVDLREHLLFGDAVAPGQRVD